MEVFDHAHVHAVYVSPAHRGSGGPAVHLMEAAIRFAKENIDVSRLTLGVHEDNGRALAFYRRIGFEMTSKVIPYRPNPSERCLIMEYVGRSPTWSRPEPSATAAPAPPSTEGSAGDQR
ncbi:hypothetical protein L3i22_036500 [Actinoplanes sp. L3-i22]|nr:hypothetical protein L3i22_036500 [Actinoplanes sp. L3-i22]